MAEPPEYFETTTIFDAKLVSIDSINQTVTFEAGEDGYTRRLSFATGWQPGLVGALRLDPDEIHFDFYAYPDQRLRRAIDHDSAAYSSWVWVIGDHHFRVRAGIIPGVAGAVVRDECQPLEVQVPPEFEFFCRDSGFEPQSLIRAFIADVTGIQDSRRCPREDRYCSSGVDQRFLAREYVRLLNRARPDVSASIEIRRPLVGADLSA